MNSAFKLLLALTVGVLAVSGVASAQTVDTCPECDEDVPANDDCAYSSVDTGRVTNRSVQLVDTDVCVHEADEDGGFWAVFSLCLTSIFDHLGEFVGVFATMDVFVSDDGMDIDGGIATSDGTLVDFDESPVGDLDDQTWGQTGDLGVEVPSTDVLPDEGVIVDECLYDEELVPCE